MSAALQVALLVTSIAFLVLMACILFIALQSRRQLEQLVLTAAQLKANLELLIDDTRELVRNGNRLVTRADEQLREVEQVVRTVRAWTGRADRFVNEVGAAIEPPVFSLVRNVALFGTAAASFLRALLHRNHHDEAHVEMTEERDHV